MPMLEGILPDRYGPMSACRWCDKPTDLTLAPPGSRIGPVPLHLACGAQFMRAYERMRAGHLLDPQDAERVRRFLPAPMPALTPPTP